MDRAVSAAVMAGGLSRRMGRDKAWLDLGDGRPLIRRVVDVVSLVADDVLIVANDDRYRALGPRVVPDRYPGSGALGGIATGLSAAAHDHVIVVACDMPSLRPEALRLLIEGSEGYDVVVPLVRGEPHPLHALYTKACLPAIETAVAEGRLRVADALAELRVRTIEEAEMRVVDPDLVSVTNLNTPEDLAALRGS